MRFLEEIPRTITSPKVAWVSHPGLILAALVGAGSKSEGRDPQDWTARKGMALWARKVRREWQRTSASVRDLGFSLGRKPKGGASQNRLPFDSQSPFPRLTYDSGRCHSCRKLNYLAGDRSPHNPKVGGSNPPPATKTLLFDPVPIQRCSVILRFRVWASVCHVSRVLLSDCHQTRFSCV